MDKQIISKDVIDANKVVDSIDSNPGQAIKELTRVMVENIQRQQLNDMNINWGMDICSQLKSASNNIFGKWAIEENLKRKKSLL